MDHKEIPEIHKSIQSHYGRDTLAARVTSSAGVYVPLETRKSDYLQSLFAQTDTTLEEFIEEVKNPEIVSDEKVEGIVKEFALIVSDIKMSWDLNKESNPTNSEELKNRVVQLVKNMKHA